MFYGIFNIHCGKSRVIVSHTEAGQWTMSRWNHTTQKWADVGPISAQLGMRLILLGKKLGIA